MSQQFRFTTQDEFPHRPDASVNFNESVYMNAFDASHRMGGWMRLGNRVNEGYAELSVCLYLPDGRIACQFQRPKITVNDKLEGGGLLYEVSDPTKRVSMRYHGEVLLLDDANLLREPEKMFAHATRAPAIVQWNASAASPIHGGEPLSGDTPTMYGRDFSLGHFNQHIAVEGFIQIGEQHWPLHAHGWRDHSWGPRYWQSIYWYRLFLANFGDGRGFMLLKIATPDGRSRKVGVLMVDGKYEDITDLDVITDWTPRQDPQRVRLNVRTATRAEVIEGEVV
ncbi:MAG TPA: hypothetical protein VHN11_03450, partial [Xanthobacteraceae bacterium]|nr:hypothetical protein [Xanthobacteraceae bacterium]